MAGHFRVAVLDGEVVGVGWLYRHAGKSELDVRVLPRARRLGVGTALFDTLTDGQRGRLHAGCDAGQQTARRFLESRRFVLREMLFAQRWDGVTADVPPAFDTVSIEQSVDASRAMDLLSEVYLDGWAAPGMGPEDLTRPDTGIWFAQRNDVDVGVMVARKSQDTWWLGGLGTRKAYRNEGVGRALITHLMLESARTGLGLGILVSASDFQTLSRTGKLGFWTYRTWAEYAREPDGVTSP